MKKIILTLLLSLTCISYAHNFTISSNYYCFVSTDGYSTYNSNEVQAKKVYIPADELFRHIYFTFKLYNNSGSPTVLRYSISYGGSTISTSGLDRKTYVPGANAIFIDEDIEQALMHLTASPVGAKKNITLDLYDTNSDLIQTINLLEVNVEAPYQGTSTDCRSFMRDAIYNPALPCQPWSDASHNHTVPYTLKILGPNFKPLNNYYSIRYLWESSNDGISYLPITGHVLDDLTYYVANPCSTFYVRRTDQLWDTRTNLVLQTAIRQSLKIFSGLDGKIQYLSNKINVNSSVQATENPTFEFNTMEGDELIRIKSLTPVANKLCTNPTATTALSIQWEYFDPFLPTWQEIPGQTSSELFGNFNFIDGTKIRRRVSSVIETKYSNEVTIVRKKCFTPSANLENGTNTICVTKRSYYNLYNGSIVAPESIIGTAIRPNINTREYAYEWLFSTDGIKWTVVNSKRLTDNDRGATNRDFTPSSINFDISKGEVQKVYFKRDYFHYYDKWNCGFTGIQPCGKNYHYQTSSNTIVIYLSAYPQPKPVPVNFTEPVKTLSCAPADQVITLSVPNLNQWGAKYVWTYPDAWMPLSNTAGEQASSTTYHTQSVHKNAVNGGRVCLTINQTDVSRTICRDYEGTSPMTVGLQPIYGGCAGQQFQIVPVIGNRDINSLHYTWTMSNPMLGNTSCLNMSIDNSCKSLKYTPKNVAIGSNQFLSLNVIDAKACSLTVQTQVKSNAGWFFGALNYLDPIAIQGSDLVLDNSKNELYYINTNRRIQKAYYGEDPTKTNVANSYWQFQEIGGNSVQSTRSVALNKNGNIYRLFYVFSGKLKYIESIDRGITWTQTEVPVGVINYLEKLKSYGNFIYVIQSNNRYVYRIDGSNPTLPAVQVTNEPVNYSDFTFNVEGGLVLYTNTANKLVVFNAVATNVSVVDPIVNITDLKWNSDIRVYNSIVWMVRNDGKLYTLSKNTATNKYDLLASINYTSFSTYNNLPPILEGKFCINTGTGAIYAKDQNDYGMDHLFQIANRNEGWSLLELAGDGYSQTGIGYSMVYGFSHAYYIGGDGRVGNSFYLEPCKPDVLRKDMSQGVSEMQQTDKFTYTAVDYGLQVSPNPAIDAVNISYYLPEESEVGFSITDMKGVEGILPYNSHSMAGDYTWSLDLKDYPQGMYVLHILVNGQKIAYHKVVKQ